MESKKFAFGFVMVFLVILAVLFYSFRIFSFGDVSEGFLTAFWAALIFLFLLFGIIVVSLYLNRIGGKS